MGLVLFFLINKYRLEVQFGYVPSFFFARIAVLIFYTDKFIFRLLFDTFYFKYTGKKQLSTQFFAMQFF